MTTELDQFAWRAEELGQALEALARKSGLSPRLAQPSVIPLSALSNREENAEAIGTWILAAARWFGFEAEAIIATYESIDKLLDMSPALLKLPSSDPLSGYPPKFLALLSGNGKKTRLLTPSFQIVEVRSEIIRSALVRDMEEPISRHIDNLVNETGVDERHRVRIKTELVRHRLRRTPIHGCWHLRLSPGSSFWQQARRLHLPQQLAMLVVAYGLEYFLWILSWWLVGKGALEGHFDRGWLLAWGLLLLTIVPFRLLGRWLQGVLSIGAGGLLRQRLLYGALRLMPEEIRHQGIGQFLGQVIESEAVEQLALSGGFLVLVAAVELLAALVVFIWGAAGSIEMGLLSIWIIVTVALASSYYGRRRAWAETRLRMTHDLIERLVGHRTRLTQLAREHWHDGEDETLERYLEVSTHMDRSAALLIALVPRGWIILSLLGLTPMFVLGHASAVALAITLGGVLLAYNAFRRLVSGLGNLADAIISWKQISYLFHAASRPELVGPPLFALTSSAMERALSESNQAHGKLIDAQELVFKYQHRGEPVLGGCTLQIHSGDRILLEGPSGGGKSTLASLLTGLRIPQSGLLLLTGLDRQTLGDDGWRRRIVSAPQFHENHVLTETFAFNLLMGRRWPPHQNDLRDAATICQELGLDDLLQRMPAGLLQMVGETGWQLSHGERSRLFIARALLQPADMIILDESFAALDPETLERALQCVLRRAPTLMVIAHP